MDKHIRVTFIFLVCAFLTFSCHGQKRMNQYEWYPTESAKAEYPMYVVSGDIYFEGGGKIYIPDERIAENGWGELGASHIVGNVEKGIPSRLLLTYFSFLENKFYSGAVDLPSEKFKSMFNEGVVNHAKNSQGDYSAVIVGMGLEGEISVWMNGYGVVTEVGQFTLPEADTPWESVLDDDEISREEFIDIVLEESFPDKDALERSKFRAKLPNFWARYKDKFPIKIYFEGTVKPLSYFLHNLNGEREYHPIASIPEKNPKMRAKPCRVILDFQSGDGTKYNLTMQFDEDAIVKVFTEVSEQFPETNYTLIIDIEDKTKHAAAYIQTVNMRIPLTNTEQKVTRYKL